MTGTLLRPEIRPTTMTPRPYQAEAVAKVFDRFRAGDRATMVVLPTGVGKTEVGGFIIREGCLRGRRSLWLAGRTDLVTQTINKMERHGLDPQREQADSYARELVGEPDLVVATPQSLNGPRLRTWPRDYFNLVIADESHHFVNGQYREPLDYFASARVLGLTATPDRADGRNLGEVFESVAEERDIWWAWSDPGGPYLCPLRVVRRDVGYDVGRLRVEGANDYSAEDLAALLTPLVEPVANVILDEVGERKTLAYVPRVAAAQALATALQSLGMHAEWVSGDDPARKEKMDRFAADDLQVLVNVDLLGEGNDLPGVSCIVDAYPTRSRARFAQRVGRGLRPDTPDCMLLCLATNSRDHRLATPADLVPQARFDDAFADWVDATIERNAGGIDLMDAVESARESARAEPEPPRVIRCRARRYMVSGRRTVLDPTAAADALGCSAGFKLSRPPRGAVIRPLSEKQVAVLANSGVRDIDRLSSRQASVLIGRLMERRAAGLASLKQVRFLIAKGVDPDAARGMSFQEASETLDRVCRRR